MIAPLPTQLDVGPRPGGRSASKLVFSAPPRSVQPELLDGLPAESPAARASRRDLRLLNRLLGSHAWFARTIRRNGRPGERTLEIGAGGGELGRTLQPLVSFLSGLDLIGRPAAWPDAAPWFQADVLNFRDWALFPLVLSNLFLHHFDREQLGRIGAGLRHARVIIACEPLRAARSRWLFAAVCPLIRAHAVTRHDGRASIAAGFRGNELPNLLRLDPAVWQWRIRETGRGAYHFVARRRS